MEINIIDEVLFKKALKGAVGLLDKNKERVNDLNVFPVPDGDTGTNMTLTIKSALKQAITVKDKDASKIALGASKGSLMGARGNSGVILSQLFRGFASGLQDKKNLDIKALAEGLKNASDTAYKAVMKPTEGTILTVARECGEFAMSISSREMNILTFLDKVIQHGNKALESTPDMLPVLKQAGVVDAGGQGFMYILQGAYNALAGIEDIDEYSEEVPKEILHHRKDYPSSEEIEYSYCTEFMVNTDFDDIDKFRENISNNGDSLLVVGGEGIIKVHVHTNNPGLVLEKGLKLGELSDIKIDNMRYQHEEILLKDELAANNENEEKEEAKQFSFVAISIGEGIDRIFKELNVDYTVPGGQTMNPSTEDIYQAVEKTKGENIFILPNNSNIILSAEQTKELSSRNIVVLPTKSIPEGISALLAFDENASLDENIQMMNENIESVKTAQITYAIRDTEYNNTKISKDDIIGLSEDDIVASGKDINGVAQGLLEKITDEDVSIITILYGKDVSEDVASKLARSLEDRFDDIDIELIYGGQPLYYYIFSLE